MSKPATRVYIAFNVGWGGITPPVWIEVTSRVRQIDGVNITAWRSEELAEAQPNTLSLTLRNDDGRFTPGNTSSPYSPNVRLSRRIKVESTTSTGTTSIRFFGYVDDWRPKWDAKVSTVNHCTVTASSRMARLGKGVELRSIVEETILDLAPVIYYPLGEPSGSAVAADITGAVSNFTGKLMTMARPAGSLGTVDFGAGTGPATDSLGAPQFTGGGFIQSKDQKTFTTAQESVSCFVAFSDLGVAAVDTTVATASNITVGVKSTGFFAVGFGQNLDFAGTVAPVINRTYHLVGWYDGTNLALYVDGVLVAAAARTPIAATRTMAGIQAADKVGVVSHLAGFDFWLTPTQIQAISDAGSTGFAGETPAARITRYATWADIDPTTLTFDSGQVANLAHIDTTGRTALDAMRTVVATEGGVLFDARNGNLTFHDRAHRYAATSAFTLSVSAGQIIEAPEPVLDDQLQVNDATAKTTDGKVTVKATDPQSVRDYGWYRQSLDLATTDPAEPLNHATWLVAKYAEPLTRISAVEVLLNKLPDTLVDALLAATVGTRFTILGMPANGPGPTLDLFVEGMTDVIDGSTHRLVLHTSPANLSAAFTIEDPDRGRIGSYPIAL